MRTLLVALGIALALAACGSPEASPPSASTASTTTSGTTSSGAPPAGVVLGGLDVELRVAPTVVAGEQVEATLVVENRSGRPIVDPDCRLANTRSGLVPVDDPDAEVWGITMTDCGGPFTYEPGAREERRVFFLYATDRFGDHLPPGAYLATYVVGGVRLQQPVTVR
jgi:hypothetical protein